jgi:hypothetical protein
MIESLFNKYLTITSDHQAAATLVGENRPERAYVQRPNLLQSQEMRP